MVQRVNIMQLIWKLMHFLSAEAGDKGKGNWPLCVTFECIVFLWQMEAIYINGRWMSEGNILRCVFNENKSEWINLIKNWGEYTLP